MAHQSAYSGHRPSLPKQLANFTNSTTGLDLTLRLIQALAMIAAEVCIDSAAVMRCLIAKSQLALARRYLRFFCFIDCFERAYGLLAGDSSGGSVLTTMELAQSSCLGVYFLMENLTILHDMNIWLVPWYTSVLMEANKFWFYAICVSIASSVGQLLFCSVAAQSTAQKDDDEMKEESAEKRQLPKPGLSNAALLARAVADGCDLTLPASFLGWTALGDLGVGMAMVVSTVIASRDVWASVQRW